MADDAKIVFIDPDGHGESIDILPHGGEEITRNAVVDRHPQAALPPGTPPGRGLTGPKMLIYVANDATSGRTSWNKGLDRIRVAYRPDKGAEIFCVIDVLGSDGGMWKLLVG